MRKILSKPYLKMFVFYGLVLIPTFFLCYERHLSFFFVVVAMLLTSLIDIPIYKFKTKKPEYSKLEAMRIGEVYGVPIAEEMQEDSAKTYKTRVTLNMGGFFIPLTYSFYILLGYPELLLELVMPVLLMAIFSYMLSEVKGGVGIVIPSYVGIFAIPIGLIFATQSESTLNAGLLMIWIFVPAIFGILLGILIRLTTRSNEEDGSAFFNIGGLGSFHSIYLISLLTLLIAVVA